ncbi:MAG TPA: phosphoglycerate kinase [Cytophagales bacterium]|nr:phosphoglycerate kinase [Cytophagales bacterium]
MKTISSFDFAGKKAVVRVDFNVPLNDKYEITDETRIKATIPTITKILNDGGSCVLMSHLGRPKEGPAEKYSLKHLVKRLSEVFGANVKFASDCIGDEALALASSLQPGEILLLENLRFYKEEEKGDVEFAKKLARYGNVWVNDAFGTAHRAHASTAIMGQFFADKVCGQVMQAELDNAEKVFGNPDRPFTAIMGGAKISDKILVIEKLLDKVDNLIIGGGMSYTFAKAFGGSIGKSICENDKLELAKEIVAKAEKKGVKLYLPTDTVIADDFNNNANRKTVESNAILDGWEGMDIGPKTVEMFSKVIESSKTVMWNGPMGVFEFPNFAIGTESVAKAVVSATNNGGYSLIGGGDSASAINNLGFGDKVSYVSTGGGALLEYLEGKELPGVTALKA